MQPDLPAPVWDADAIYAFIERAFPAAHATGVRILAIEPGELEVEQPFSEDFLRPGGTISGPTQMTLADLAFYYLLLAQLGEEALAVTTHLSFNFLRKPPAGPPIRARARLLKLGRRLCVGDVLLHCGDGGPIAHAQVTYSRPDPKR